jgi:cell division protein FtsL
MSTVETILVIVLGAALLILLVLAIVVIAFLIKILGNVKRISQKAESATENISDLAAMVGKKVAPVALSAVVTAVLRRFKK